MKQRFEGYLYSKLRFIGTRSEGPFYFLQRWDYTEIPVVKKADSWEEDPLLHRHVARKVKIEGVQAINGILYDEIHEHVGPSVMEVPTLQLDLDLGTELLRVNRMPPHPPTQSLELKLLVNWPDRGVWRGLCPTSQMFDFWIERGGAEIWRWSEGRIFRPVSTPVELIGGEQFYPYTEVWSFDPMKLVDEGVYTARALFVASGQEVSESFEVRFLYAVEEAELGVV